jgi:hypothetical protein
MLAECSHWGIQSLASAHQLKWEFPFARRENADMIDLMALKLQFLKNSLAVEGSHNSRTGIELTDG